MIKIKFYNPETLDKNLRATIHKTGKMGFTVDAAKKLKLEVGKSAGIGSNEDDPDDKNLYMVMYDNTTGGAFKISKAGLYFYINTKLLFDNLKMDYVKDNISYDIEEVKEEAHTYYVLKRREKAKKDKIE